MVQTPVEERRPAGLRIETVDSPLRGGPEDEDSGPPPPITSAAPRDEKQVNDVPLDPAILKFSLNAITNAAVEITKYPGWTFSDEEMEALCDALALFGIMVPAVANAILVCVAIVVGKATGYVMWVKAGKPPVADSTRRLLEQGAEEIAEVQL